MNKNKVIALIIIIAVFLGPFYRLFIYNNGNGIVDSSGEMFMFLGWIIGMIVAFYISVNEPFGKNKATAATVRSQSEKSKAA